MPHKICITQLTGPVTTARVVFIPRSLPLFSPFAPTHSERFPFFPLAFIDFLNISPSLSLQCNADPKSGIRCCR